MHFQTQTVHLPGNREHVCLVVEERSAEGVVGRPVETLVAAPATVVYSVLTTSFVGLEKRIGECVLVCVHHSSWDCDSMSGRIG